MVYGLPSWLSLLQSYLTPRGRGMDGHVLEISLRIASCHSTRALSKQGIQTTNDVPALIQVNRAQQSVMGSSASL